MSGQHTPGPWRASWERYDKHIEILPDGSPLREQINQSLLTHINDQSWRDKVAKYLGK